MAATVNASTSAGVVITPDNSGVLALQSSSTTALTINASQNVGIGTASPTEKLTVSGAVIATSIATSIARDGTIVDYESGVASRFIAGRAGGNYGSWRAYVAGVSGVTLRQAMEYEGSCRWYGEDGSSERMRITSAGDLVVGKTATGISTQGFGAYSTGEIEANAGSNPAAYFNRTNAGTIMQFRLAGTTVGTISVSSGATAYNTSSDYRLKENIAPMTGALAKVAQLKPVIYKWKADGSDGEGFIAHELAEVVPHAVNGDKDAVDADGNPVYQGIDTSFLVATLTAAIQELKAINDTQAATITALTGRIVALENK